MIGALVLLLVVGFVCLLARAIAGIIAYGEDEQDEQDEWRGPIA